MTSQERLDSFKKFAPAFYDISIALVCFYIFFHVRNWLNLLFTWETGYLLGAILISYYIVNISHAKKFMVAKTKAFSSITSTSTFIVMYLSMGLIVADIIYFITKIFISNTQTLNNLIIILGFIILVFVIIAIIFGCYKARKIVIKNYQIDDLKLKNNYRIILLTDLHIGFFVGLRHIRRMVDKINKLDADMIVISGDIINAGNTLECPDIHIVAHLLSKLKSKEGTFAVVGNHDPDINDPDFQEFLTDSNIRLLEDSSFTNENFHLVGRTTCTKPRLPLNELISKFNDNKPIVVLDHDPVGIKEAISEKIDLIMCGHTHKGQIFPLNLFVRMIYSKGQTWGMEKNENTTSIVSAGVGYFSMPMRIGSNSEIVCVDIKA